MRLIDAEELKHKVNNSKYYGTKQQRDFCDMIAESPTIDAVEVVRCEDCRHQEHCHETIAHTRDHGGFREHWSEPIEWCSRGKRRGSEE